MTRCAVEVLILARFRLIWRISGCRCGPANAAIMADVTPESLRSTVYAFDRSFEGKHSCLTPKSAKSVCQC